MADYRAENRNRFSLLFLQILSGEPKMLNQKSPSPERMGSLICTAMKSEMGSWYYPWDLNLVDAERYVLIFRSSLHRIGLG